ncbi:opsin, ultraviolet-sensitive-like [Artemia franciscana]|uniref:opsin, ultraviolet-sensitive-like n=1 Tax=Artemia franciscana TaxID=6661 RepID=UPI0032DA722C
MVITMQSPIVIVNSFWNGPVLGDIGCQIYGFVGGLAGTASIISLAILAFNRYRVISKPFDLERKSTQIKSMLQIVFIWFYSLCFASLPLFGISRYVPEGYLTSCSFEYLTDNIKNRIFILAFFFGAWCVPCFIILFSYISIVSVVHRSKFKISENMADNLDRQKLEIQVTKTVFGLISTWMIAWTPYAIVVLLGISNNKEYITPFSSMLCGTFCKISACSNPFLYALAYPPMKKEITKMFNNFCLSGKSDVGHLALSRRKISDTDSDISDSFPGDYKAGFAQYITNKDTNETHLVNDTQIC